MNSKFNGLGMNQGNLSRLSNALSRSISPENFTGEAGKGGMATEGTGANVARDLGQGWKISPDGKDQYCEYTTAYAGLPQVIRPDGLYNSQQRFGMYRWHVCDPIRFKKRLRVTIQALGWTYDWRYLQLQDDISATAFWYQATPTPELPKLPEKDFLAIN